jgi:hypothetical protein
MMIMITSGANLEMNIKTKMDNLRSLDCNLWKLQMTVSANFRKVSFKINNNYQALEEIKIRLFRKSWKNNQTKIVKAV